MLKLDAEYIITGLVDDKLDRKKSPEYIEGGHIRRHAVSLVVQAHLASYTDGEDFSIGNRIHFLFCGNTNVFMAVEDHDDRWLDARDVPVNRWVNTSNHDSCWRSDGVGSRLADIYFEMATWINEQREAAGLDKIAPVEMHQHNTFGLGSFTKEWIVTHSPDMEQGSSHWRKVSLLEPTGK